MSRSKTNALAQSAQPEPFNAVADAPIAEQDRNTVRMLAHSAKGSGSMVCATAYSEAAADIEEGAGSLPFQDLYARQAKLRHAFQAFCQETSVQQVTLVQDSGVQEQVSLPGVGA